MANCPICETEYSPETIEICPVCGWDLTPYPPTLGEIPQSYQEKAQTNLAWSRKKWDIMADHQRQIKQLQAQLETQQSQYGESHKINQQLQKQLEIEQDQYQESQRQVKQFQEQLATLQGDYQSILNAVQEAQRKSEHFEQDNKQLQETIQNHKRDLREIEQQFNQELKQKKIVEDQLYMSQVECKNYKEQINELQKKLKTYHSTNPSKKTKSYWDRPDNL